MKEISEKLDVILTKVTSLESRINDLWKYNNMDTYKEFPPLLHSNSPVKLTSLGEKVLVEYKGDIKINENEIELISEIEKREFKSPLDVQEFSERIVMSKFNSDEFIDIKNKIYHNPNFEGQSVTIRTMAMVMGLYLRDKYLNKHKDLLENSLIAS